jgi:hypothetical protein
MEFLLFDLFIPLPQIMVFFTREIGQNGPNNDIGRFDQGAILDKLISTMFTLTIGLFY